MKMSAYLITNYRCPKRYALN